jgi:hypothetical protein
MDNVEVDDVAGILKKVRRMSGEIGKVQKILTALQDSLEANLAAKGGVTNLRDVEFIKSLVNHIKRNGPQTETQIRKAFTLPSSMRGTLWHNPLRKLTRRGVLAHNYESTRDEPYYFVREMTEADIASPRMHKK